jgi:hypothetical protein
MEQIVIRAYQAFDYESITVSTTAVGLTASKFNSYAAYEIKAYMTLETAQIRWRLDGTNPTSSEGHLLEVGTNLTVEGYKNLSQFKAIRTGTTDGVLKVTYMIVK